jgi:hypothetical protein
MKAKEEEELESVISMGACTLTKKIFLKLCSILLIVM